MFGYEKMLQSLLFNIFLLGKPKVNILVKDSFFEQRSYSANIVSVIPLFPGFSSKKKRKGKKFYLNIQLTFKNLYLETECKKMEYFPP